MFLHEMENLIILFVEKVFRIVKSYANYSYMIAEC